MATHDHELTCEPSSTTLLQCSSIALLQERFRQLQKVKKMREEKELLRTMPEPDFSSSNSSLSSLLDHRPTPKWSFSHPDLIHFRSRSSFKFQPPDRSEFKNYDTQLSIGFYGSDYKSSGFVQNSGSREMDVDTSLHL